MNDAKSYIAPVELGDVMRGGCVSEVVASKDQRFQVGDVSDAVWASWRARCALRCPRDSSSSVRSW
jgi:NADPH-dependent curcumin reductase CurA